MKTKNKLLKKLILPVTIGASALSPACSSPSDTQKIAVQNTQDSTQVVAKQRQQYEEFVDSLLTQLVYPYSAERKPLEVSVDNFIANRDAISREAQSLGVDSRREIDILRRYTEDRILNSMDPAPAQLPDVASFGLNWENLLRESLHSLNDYSIGRDSFDYQTIATAYGVLQTGDHNLDLQKAIRDPEFGPSFKRKVMKKIMQSGPLQRTFYGWAKPELRKAFRCLSENEQNTYTSLVQHAADYLRDFDYGKEAAHLEYLTRIGMDYKFTHVDPDGNENPFRKIETFLFRRIRDGARKDDLSYWATRLREDMEKWKKDQRLDQLLLLQ